MVFESLLRPGDTCRNLKLQHVIISCGHGNVARFEQWQSSSLTAFLLVLDLFPPQMSRPKTCIESANLIDMGRDILVVGMHARCIVTVFEGE